MNCENALTVYDDEIQAFCANTWCKSTTNNTTTCACPLFNGPGLAPVSSKIKYSDDPNVIVSTYDIEQGSREGRPTMCFGKYVDCYGRPCTALESEQDKVTCHCKIKEGPFLTASQNCGPDKNGYLPNGAPVEHGKSGLFASANDILKLMQN